MPARNVGNDVQFDQRLFNTSKGMDSGYADEDAYNVYDKPWRGGGDLAQHIYRPGKNVDKEVYGDDIEKIIKTNRCVLLSSKFLHSVYRVMEKQNLCFL